MQVRFTFLAIIILTAVQGFPQRFNGGVLGGVGASEISGDRLRGPNKAGIYAGGFINLYISQRSSFQMELDFIQKGSRKNPDTLNLSSYLLRINYVEIPVHYKYDFTEKWSLETGLSLGVLMNAFERVDMLVVEGVYPDFYWHDLSFNIGLFYSLAERLRLNIRYSNSILPVRAHFSGQTYRWNLGQYNEVLSFTLHYQLQSLAKE